MVSLFYTQRPQGLCIDMWSLNPQSGVRSPCFSLVPYYGTSVKNYVCVCVCVCARAPGSEGGTFTICKIDDQYKFDA